MALSEDQFVEAMQHVVGEGLRGHQRAIRVMFRKVGFVLVCVAQVLMWMVESVLVAAKVTGVAQKPWRCVCPVLVFPGWLLTTLAAS